jgi:hypothetical protein
MRAAIDEEASAISEESFRSFCWGTIRMDLGLTEKVARTPGCERRAMLACGRRRDAIGMDDGEFRIR